MANFQTIQRHSRLEAITEELLVQTITLSEIKYNDITLELHLSLQECNNQVTESQKSNVELANSAKILFLSFNLFLSFYL